MVPSPCCSMVFLAGDASRSHHGLSAAHVLPPDPDLGSRWVPRGSATAPSWSPFLVGPRGLRPVLVTMLPWRVPLQDRHEGHPRPTCLQATPARRAGALQTPHSLGSACGCPLFRLSHSDEGAGVSLCCYFFNIGRRRQSHFLNNRSPPRGRTHIIGETPRSGVRAGQGAPGEQAGPLRGSWLRASASLSGL